LLAWPFLAILCAHAAAADFQIDADYPGGNIRIIGTTNDTVYLAPDLRDIQKGQWWFYFNFRLRAPVGEAVTFVFTEKNPIGVRGPAVSHDGGAAWQWLGKESVRSFQHDGKPAW